LAEGSTKVITITFFIGGRESPMIDRYTKSVLTVVAVSLVIIAL